MYRIGQTIKLKGVVTRYNPVTELVCIAYPNVTEGNYPLCFFPLKISPIGKAGYMPPDQLPFDNPNYVANITPSNKCTHRRTGEECRLRYDPLFPLNGVYYLTPTNGSPSKSAVSKKWTDKDIHLYIETLKGKNIEITGAIHAIYDTEKEIFHKEVFPNKILVQRNRKIVFFIVFSDGSIEVFPGILFLAEVEKVNVRETQIYD